MSLMELKVSGHSDDIVCVEGDIEEEFYFDDGSPVYLAFSDGTLVQVEYTNSGIWSIHILASGFGASVKHDPATNIDDDYSDVVTIHSEISWVLYGQQLIQS